MSKMGQLAMELEEQAIDLGFTGLAEATRAGYKWKIDEADGTEFTILYKPEDDGESDIDTAYRERYEEYEAEKKDLIEDLAVIIGATDNLTDDDPVRKTLLHAQKFISEAKL